MADLAGGEFAFFDKTNKIGARNTQKVCGPLCGDFLFGGDHADAVHATSLGTSLFTAIAEARF